MRQIVMTMRRVLYWCCAVATWLALCGPVAGVAAQSDEASGVTPSATSFIYLPLLISTHPFATEVVTLTNVERSKVGCGSLSANSTLMNVAQAHSQDMALNNFFNHVNLQGQGPGQRISAAGYPASWWAENIAAGYGTPAQVISGWMASEGHRDNILNCNLLEIGVGYYFQSNDQANVLLPNGSTGGPYFSYWTQVFGTR